MTHRNLASTMLCAGYIVEKCVAWRPLFRPKPPASMPCVLLLALSLRASDVVKEINTLRHLILSHALWSDGWQRRVTLNGPNVASFTFKFALENGMCPLTAYSPSGVQQISNRGLSVLLPDQRIKPSCG